MWDLERSCSFMAHITECLCVNGIDPVERKELLIWKKEERMAEMACNFGKAEL